MAATRTTPHARPHPTPPALAALAAGLALTLLSGCAGPDPGPAIAQANREAASFTGGKLAFARNAPQRAVMAAEVVGLLREPLTQAAAVQVALANSPALQALLADSAAELAQAQQAGRIGNPLLSLSRMRGGGAVEIERSLSIGLLDLLTLPQRAGVARHAAELAQLRLTGQTIDHITLVRQAWVRAVAAQQSLAYALQVADSADAGAELARRMQAAGNVSKLAQARQQVLEAEAAIQLAQARHAATAAREDLVRLLGLTGPQAAQLALPERLPDLPAAIGADELAKAATERRLDIRLARANLEAAAAAQGLALATSLVDIELGLRRSSASGAESGGAGGAEGAGHRAGTASAAGGAGAGATPAPGASETGSPVERGVELGLRLPLFDDGGALRARMDAQTLAQANRLEAALRAAGPHLRSSHSAYLTAHDIARRYRDQVLPLRKQISDETLLRYNGMLTGVFELLADARDQIRTVREAIDAGQAFWLADAALQAALLGSPGATPESASATGRAAGSTESTSAAANAASGAPH